MLTDKDTFDLRYTVPEDEPYLRKWLNWPGVIEWYPFRKENEKELMIRNWIGFCKYKCSLTATYKGKAIGIATLFLMPYRKVAHASMLYMIVDPHMWKKGVGSSLLKNILHLAKNYFRLESVHFDIFEGCPLEGILLKAGFKQICRQEKWIKEADGTYKARLLMEAKL